ncbi:phage tail tape measure protein [Bacteroides sp. CR5/BHMF/2]|nr:phage tail tape measure protein [Bacteroides sp. CR5/BHMF/2]
MFNAYMAYSFVKSELSSAVDYSNIMESARSILKVADSDLSTFETRFQQMSYSVRQIGVDTKFTAVEIASAAKFLAMAGMDIATINASMRPITNLALIGDNDVGLIADLTTNIMSGYNINSGSMGTVADIITSTISRANVNVVEMAESFKMAAGYLKLSGVDFSEASAAIGILGNAGMKGTMAGTALRAMSTRFAKPTKQAEATLDRLGVKFTQFTEIAGKKVEKLRPLAEIFKDLHDAGASLEDMISIFSKIGGNAAMQFVVNYDKLRVLTTQNRASHGISDELALIKQNTTKGCGHR